MNKSVIAIIAGTACLLAAGATSAEDTDRSKLIATADSPFDVLDRNHDRRLSRSEAGFDRLLSQTFAEIDTDGDGFVSRAEFAAAEKVRSAATTNLTSR